MGAGRHCKSSEYSSALIPISAKRRVGRVPLTPIRTARYIRKVASTRPLMDLRSSRRDDTSVVHASLVYAALMAFLQGGQYMLGVAYSAIPAFCLLALFCHVTWIRKSISDPFSLVLLFGFIYSAFPLMFGIPGSWASLRFGYEGASAIYAVGNVSMALGVAVVTLVIGDSRIGRPPASHQAAPNQVSLKAGYYSSLLSCLLIGGLIAKRGSVLLGHGSYGDSFRPEAKAGTGILLLAAPLAAGGVALMITSNIPLRLFHHIVGLAGYGGLYLALAQRKYLIFPAVLYVARYVRFRSLLKLAALLAIAGAGMTVFLYLGFLRSETSGYSQMLHTSSIARFTSGHKESLAGESFPVFATATAAHDRFIAPLPYWGDYLGSWMMCLPNFVYRSPFVPVNERFSRTYDPRAASEGMGWGFSFFGEAFLVGGYPMIVVATFVMMGVFRWLYIKGGRDLRSGILGAISLSVLPHTFWFQRNAVAYFVKEFLVLQVGTIALAYLATRSLPKLRGARAALHDRPLPLEHVRTVVVRNPLPRTQAPSTFLAKHVREGFNPS